MSTQQLEAVTIQPSNADNTSEKLQSTEGINLNLESPVPMPSRIGIQVARQGWFTETTSVVITFLQNAPLFAHKMKCLKRPLIYIALQLILAFSLQLLFASSALAIQFNPAPYGGWQTGCHYPNPPILNPAAGSPNPDIKVIQLTAANQDCGATCANTINCSHFVKTTDGPHGTCYLKSGSVPSAVAGNPNYYVCGYVAHPKSQTGICLIRCIP